MSLLSSITKSIGVNVPDLPGVPSLTRILNATTVSGTVGAVISDISAIKAAFFAKTVDWGVYATTDDKRTTKLISPDSIIELEHRADSKVSAFPVQAGKFANYNKVANPNEVIFRMVMGSTEESRRQLLDQLDQLQKSLTTVDVYTPERRYKNLNLQRYALNRRGAENAFYLDVDVAFIEIREVEVSYSSSTLSAGSIGNPLANTPLSTSMPTLDPAKVVNPIVSNVLNVGRTATNAINSAASYVKKVVGW